MGAQARSIVLRTTASLMMLAACNHEDRSAASALNRTFPAAHVSRVVFRAADAKRARIQKGKAGAIVVSGRPHGGAPGYHPSGEWRETPANEWGLDFRAKLYGNTLVISTFNEIQYIHHSYYIDELSIAVPDGVQVILEPRQPTGEGAPDLREPAKD
ncbi:MAG: hypothetical protein ACXW29_04975 [Thermoanaerobaculia bacterium]